MSRQTRPASQYYGDSRKIALNLSYPARDQSAYGDDPLVAAL